MNAISLSEENPNEEIVKEPYEKYERKTISHLPVIDYLQFGKCIGQGTFSHVYKGIYHQNNQVAIKLIDRGSDYLIKNEIDILTKLKDVPHIVQLYEVIYCDQPDDDEYSNNSENSQTEQNQVDSIESNQSEKSPTTSQVLNLKPSSFSKLTLLVFEYLKDINTKSSYKSFSLNQIRILPHSHRH